MLENFLRFSWDLPKICPEFYLICPVFAWDFPRICPRIALDLSYNCKKITWDLLETCLRFAQDLNKICTKFAQYLPEIFPRSTWHITFPQIWKRLLQIVKFEKTFLGEWVRIVMTSREAIAFKNVGALNTFCWG